MFRDVYKLLFLFMIMTFTVILVPQAFAQEFTKSTFFENVVVNDENENMKKNKLELLEMFCNTFDNFIDFSKIEGV